MPLKFNNDFLTLERLRSALSYDRETGVFVRLDGRRTDFIGRPAGHISKVHGYNVIRIDGVLYRGGRLAWFYCTGEWPSGLVDHIDGCRSNDRFENLRQASSQQNNANKAWSKSETGFKGIYRTRYNKYVARLVWKRTVVRLGVFDDPRHAAAAYNIGARTCFGDFARTNKI